MRVSAPFSPVLLARLAATATILALLGAACQAAPSPTPTATTAASRPSNTATATAPMATPIATPDPFASVPGIVDPSNHGWPREVEGLNGRVTIAAKPARIITASVGHDEVTLALVPVERLVGVGSSTQNPTYSNVADAVQDVPTISADPETIVAQSPDVVVTSPFLPTEAVDALNRVGIPVVQTDLANDHQARLNDILLLGYIYGEEERALAIVQAIDRRYKAVASVAQAKPESERRRVLALTRYSDQIWSAGVGSTEGAIIEAAGGINVAAEAGVQQNAVVSLEGVISMAPDLIIIAQPPEFGADEFRQDLLNDPALAEVPAIQSEEVHLVDGKAFTTLSFWNVRGVEQLAKLLWSENFADLESPPFALRQ